MLCITGNKQWTHLRSASVLITILSVQSQATPAWTSTYPSRQNVSETDSIIRMTTGDDNTTFETNDYAPLPLGWLNLLSAAAIVLLAGGLGLILVGLPNLARDLTIACCRSVVQLYMVGGFILSQFLITDHAPNPYMVWGWIGFTATLASQEALTRVEYFYPRLRYHLLCALFMASVTIISATLALKVLGPIVPWFSPRTWIPVCGMVFGNSLNAMALAAGCVTRAMATKVDEIELRLSRGATWREAVSFVIRTSFETALTPSINSLSVTGVVNIPGMMTGQILAGQSPYQAAAYQVVILFLISSTSCLSVQAIIYFAMTDLVDKQNDRLRTYLLERVVSKNGGRSIGSWSRFLTWFNAIFNTLKVGVDERNDDVCESIALRKFDGSASRILGDNCEFSSSLDSSPAVLSIRGMKVPRANIGLSMDLNVGERLALRGRSGTGKSQILRTIAGLEVVDPKTLRLNGVEPACMPEWRCRIALVPQGKPTLEGTPRDFYEQIIRFKFHSTSSTRDSNKRPRRAMSASKPDPAEIAEEWDLQASAFDQLWSSLSGGQAQRASLAIALALSPDVLLLDESTSALDDESALKVEATLARSGISIIMASHSNAQVKRFCNRQIDLSTDDSERMEVNWI